MFHVWRGSCKRLLKYECLETLSTRKTLSESGLIVLSLIPISGPDPGVLCFVMKGYVFKVWKDSCC